MLSKVFRTILETSAEASAANGPSLNLLREVWPTLLGEPLCHRTQPTGWHDGVLTVGVASEHWLHEVRRNHRRIHGKIQRLLPWPVDELKFVVESLPPAPKAARAPSADATPSSEVDESLRQDLDRLDASTREIMLRIRGHLERGD
jgi:hypothetical protein